MPTSGDVWSIWPAGLSLDPGSAGAGWRVVAMDGFAVWADDLTGAVGVDDEFPAQLVQQHMVMPGAVTLQVGQAGRAAVSAVDHMMGFTRRGGLITAPGVLALLIPQRDQPAQVHRDVIGLRHGQPGGT